MSVLERVASVLIKIKIGIGVAAGIGAGSLCARFFGTEAHCGHILPERDPLEAIASPSEVGMLRHNDRMVVDTVDGGIAVEFLRTKWGALVVPHHRVQHITFTAAVTVIITISILIAVLPTFVGIVIVIPDVLRPRFLSSAALGFLGVGYGGIHKDPGSGLGLDYRLHAEHRQVHLCGWDLMLPGEVV